MSIVSFPAHDQYKDSGIDWIGKIPVSWSVEPGRQCLYENKEKNIGMRESTVLSLSYGQIIVKDASELTGLVPESFETYQIVAPGDIIIRGTDLQNDKTSLRTGLAKDAGIITSAYINLRPKSNISPKFLHYLFHAYDTNKVFYALGRGLRQNLSYEDFKYLQIPIPQQEEQRAIAAFLDEKCSKIDEAVRIREEQIALLRERRQIMIQQAVTHGLNPDAPMKDSGIDWIGQIPAHWETNKISHVARVDSGSTPSRSVQQYWGGGIPWIKTSEINYSTIYESEETITELGLRESSLRLAPPGTLLMAMYGQGITRGRVAILGVTATYNQACCGISFKDKIDVNYAQNYFVAAYPYFRDAGNETSQMNLSLAYIASLKISNPPKKEQLKINQFIDKNERQIGTAISIKKSQITALKEYKTVLINAAVTGKIKVAPETTEISS